MKYTIVEKTTADSDGDKIVKYYIKRKVFNLFYVNIIKIKNADQLSLGINLIALLFNGFMWWVNRTFFLFPVLMCTNVILLIWVLSDNKTSFEYLYEAEEYIQKKIKKLIHQNKSEKLVEYDISPEGIEIKRNLK